MSIRSVSFLFLVATLSLAAPVAAGRYNSTVSIGDAMPAFEKLPEVKGGTLSSADISETVVVLVSLANHCPWVRGMDGDLVSLVASLKGKDVRVVGFAVNRQDDDRLPAMQAHAKRYGYNFDYVYDESQDLGRKLGATRTPEYFVYDKQRKLVYTGLLHDSPARMGDEGKAHYTEGEPDEFYVRDAVEAVLAGKPVPVAETRPHGCSVKYE